MGQETEMGLVEWLIILVLLAIVAVAVLGVIGPQIMEATIFTDHAMTSHADQIAEIEECFENGEIHGPFDTSYGRMCEYASNGGKNIYWRIFECDGGDKIVITQFKQAANRLINYMFNHGMEPVQGDPGC